MILIMHTFILLTKFTKRWQPTLSPLHCSKLAFSFQQSIVDFVILTNDDLYICLVTTCLDMVSHFDHVSQSTPVTCLRLTTHPRLLLAVRCTTWYASEGERHTKDFQSNLGPFNELRQSGPF